MYAYECTMHNNNSTSAMSAEAAAFVCVNLFLGSAAVAGSFFVLLEMIVALII